MTLAGYVSAPFTYPGGAVAVGVPVRVYYSGTSALVRLAYDASGALKGNPVRTGDDGRVSFWVEPGNYDLYANGVRTPVTVPAGGGTEPINDEGASWAFSVATGSGAGTGKNRRYNDTGATLTISSVRVSVDTLSAPSLVIDVKRNGTTIFTNPAHRPTVAAPGGTVKATTIDSPTLADGDYLTVDVVSAGSYVDLVVQIQMN